MISNQIGLQGFLIIAAGMIVLIIIYEILQRIGGRSRPLDRYKNMPGEKPEEDTTFYIDGYPITLEGKGKEDNNQSKISKD